MAVEIISSNISNNDTGIKASTQADVKIKDVKMEGNRVAIDICDSQQLEGILKSLELPGNLDIEMLREILQTLVNMGNASRESKQEAVKISRMYGFLKALEYGASLAGVTDKLINFVEKFKESVKSLLGMN